MAEKLKKPRCYSIPVETIKNLEIVQRVTGMFYGEIIKRAINLFIKNMPKYEKDKIEKEQSKGR